MNKETRTPLSAEEQKLITFTLEYCRDMDLIYESTQNIMLEIEAMAMSMHEDDFPRTLKITIDKKYTQTDLKNLRYDG